MGTIVIAILLFLITAELNAINNHLRNISDAFRSYDSTNSYNIGEDIKSISHTLKKSYLKNK